MKHLAAAEKKQAYPLTMPDFEALTGNELKRLVDTGGAVSLHLGNTPLIRLEDVVELANTSSIQHLTHQMLYSRPFDLTIGTPFTASENRWSHGLLADDDTNFPLQQVVYVTTLAGSINNTQHLDTGGIKWSQFADSTVSSRDLGATAVTLLTYDALMAPDRVMKLVPMALRRLVATDGFKVSSTMRSSTVLVGIAKQAAVGEDRFVSYIPGFMYETWMTAGTSTAEERPKGNSIIPRA